MIKFYCPKCGKKVSAPESVAGSPVICPDERCGFGFEAPRPRDSAAPIPQARLSQALVSRVSGVERPTARQPLVQQQPAATLPLAAPPPPPPPPPVPPGLPSTRLGNAHKAVETPREDLDGMGGWLILPAIGLVATAGFLFVGFFSAVLLMNRFSEVSASTGFLMALCVDAVQLIFTLVVAIIFFRKLPVARIAMPAFYLANILFAAVAAGLLASEPGAELEVKEIGTAIVAATLWVPYFLVSKRVKATFRRR